jgi:carbonic anhydrase/acetyltransferase-like protein (isoleucine patch superfamily)
MLIPYHTHTPVVAAGVFIAPTAVIIGQVEIGEGASIWYGAVLRGDNGRIVIGRGTNVQDNATVHVPNHGATLIGDDVTIGHGAVLEGHGAVLEGCVVEQGALIGINAVVLPGAVIGAYSLVGAGSVVPEHMAVPPRTLVAGVPAQVKKPLSGSSADWVQRAAAHYRELAQAHLAATAQHR